MDTPQFVETETDEVRGAARGITGDDFEKLWPDVARRLERYLGRCRPSDVSIEDVVQEVALRALRQCADWQCADELFRWAKTVGLNIVADHYRALAHVDFREIPKLDLRTADVATEVEARVTLERVLAAFGTLSMRDQEALRSVCSASDRPSQVRSAVRRLRARERLRAACDGLVATLTWCGRRIRRLGPSRTVLIVAVIVPLGLLIGPRHDPPGRVQHADRPPGLGDVARHALPSPAAKGEDSNRHAVADTAKAEDSPSASKAILPHHFAVLTPSGRTVTITGREKRPDDHLLCVSAYTAGTSCFDAPPLPLPDNLP